MNEKENKTELTADEKDEIIPFSDKHPNIKDSKALMKSQKMLLAFLLFTGNCQKGSFTYEIQIYD